MSTGPWWRPDLHADRRPFLLARGAIRKALRGWFEARGFTEVECAALQVSPGNETHLHAFATQALDEAGRLRPLYLHTSPEFAAKKLLAAGETRIVDFARVYRNREGGPLHSPEFTMLEWYRAGASWNQVIEDAVEICVEAALAIDRRVLTWRGRDCDIHAEPERLTLVEAFERHAGLDLERWIDEPESAASDARGAGVRVGEGDSWSDLFSRVVVEKIEPHLGQGRLTVLCEYPTEEAALARPLPADPRFAERFELYACGVELANGFGELTDPVEQRRRFEADMALKQALYGETYPIDADFLAALSVMPDASGCALGFDRLVMLATGAHSIQQVLWTPPG